MSCNTITTTTADSVNLMYHIRPGEHFGSLRAVELAVKEYTILYVCRENHQNVHLWLLRHVV